MKNQKIFFFIISLIGAYLLFPAYLFSVQYPLVYQNDQLWKSLDPSWIVTLNYASLKNLEWGKEFVFTFGPLGFLSTKFLWGVNKYVVLFFDLFIFFNFSLFFYKSLIKHKKESIIYLLIFFISIFLPNYFGSSIAIILLAFLIFWINLSLKEKEYKNYLFQIICLFLLFYIKVNTGIIAFLFYFIALVYNFAVKKITIYEFVFFLAAPFFIIYTFTYVFNVDLIDYYFNSLELISGYNEVMYLDIGENYLYYLYAIPLLGFLLTLFVFEIRSSLNDKKTILKTLISFFNIGALWFITYKQSFLRADINHILEYFITSLIILLIAVFFYFDKYKKLTRMLVLLITILSSYVIFSIKGENTFNLSDKFIKTNYIDRFVNYDSKECLNIFPNENQLPSEILNTINTSTVDVYPWNSLLLFENKLNFNPRPVFQSYTTYTNKLQLLNFNYYNSEEAPEYVIFEISAIDNRYSLFDDSKLNLTLWKNYKSISDFNFKGRKMILMKKKEDFKKINLIKKSEYAQYFDAPIIPKEDILYEIEIYENGLGKLYSLIRHSPEINLQINTKDGKSAVFRTSKGLLKGGIFSNKYLNDTQSYLDNKDKIQVKSYKFLSSDSNMYKDKIKITEYKITQ